MEYEQSQPSLDEAAAQELLAQHNILVDPSDGQSYAEILGRLVGMHVIMLPDGVEQ